MEPIIATAFFLALAGAKPFMVGNVAVAFMAVCWFGLALQWLAMDEEGEGVALGNGDDIASAIDNSKNNCLNNFLVKIKFNRSLEKKT